MTSPDQLAANRRNAKKSTGPTSAGGKAITARNACKHGLHAKDVVCADEQSREYEAFATALYADLAPADSVEEQLVDRIVTCTWRLQRMTLAEASMFDAWHCSDAGHDDLQPGESPYSRRFDRATSEMLALSRYEASLDRALSRAYALLERRQARRRGEAVTAPVTVLVEGLDDSAKSLADKTNYEKCETKPIAEALIEDASAAPLDAAKRAVVQLDG
jgi:hypothetical protein